MPLPDEKLFERRLMHTGTCETTCLRCHTSVGSAFWEFELDELEARHVCRMEEIDLFAMTPANRKQARKQPGQDPATPRRHARRLGRAERIDLL